MTENKKSLQELVKWLNSREGQAYLEAKVVEIRKLLKLTKPTTP